MRKGFIVRDRSLSSLPSKQLSSNEFPSEKSSVSIILFRLYRPIAANCLTRNPICQAKNNKTYLNLKSISIMHSDLQLTKPCKALGTNKNQ